MTGIRVETKYKHILYKSAARCVGNRSRTQAAWKDYILDLKMTRGTNLMKQL